MKYAALVILFLLSACLREEKCDLSEGEIFYVLSSWGEGENLPQGLRVTFYALPGGDCVQDDLPTKGGEVVLKEGKYAWIIYNNDSERVLFRSVTDYHRHEAYTRKIFRPSYSSPVRGEETFEQPDDLWVDHQGIFTFSDSSRILRVHPRQLVKTYKVKISVEGLTHVQAVRGAMTGMVSSVMLSDDRLECEPGTVFFNMEIVGEEVECTFLSFGICSDEDSEPEHYLAIEFLLPNGILQRNINVTDQMDSLVNGGCLEIDKEIIIPPCPDDTDVGFVADVKKWDEVVIHVPI